MLLIIQTHYTLADYITISIYSSHIYIHSCRCVCSNLNVFIEISKFNDDITGNDWQWETNLQTGTKEGGGESGREGGREGRRGRERGKVKLKC